ncbi:HP1 family phage holin [Cronobacter sakazakii]|uniref:HP1 family phage holin n=1 Tax=Cronobacter sakazakii TaxID=28141 RepID=UPI000BE9235A|nr:HP1 family phage holin [Cronobacter sakazakii]PQY10340.1 hypothetical protein C5941_19990 [Cronobacter sakazakii]PXY66719.1 hypothetical protein CDT90_020510 [Cronobacter sakazakii]
MSEVSREVCEEYLDALVTVELAAKLAQKDGRKVIAGIVVALLTFGINWYYKRKTTLAQIQAYERWPSAAGQLSKED